MANLNDIVTGLKKFLAKVIHENIVINIIPAPTILPVRIDILQMEQVLLNLTTNARDAMPKGGTLTIETGITEMDNEFKKTYGYGEPGRYALLTVSDTGMGMDEKTRAKIFEPFFTTKEVGKGTGLGLAMVYGIIKQHSGYINVYSEPEKGATFKIYLPLLEITPEELVKPKEAVVLPARGAETILLAEDDADVRILTKTVLEEYGYTVIEAVDGAEALEKFRANQDKIHMLIFDIIMPRMSGGEAYEQIKKIMPHVKVLFLSGYPADIAQVKEVIDVKQNLLLKPISPLKLLDKVRKTLNEK